MNSTTIEQDTVRPLKKDSRSEAQSFDDAVAALAAGFGDVIADGEALLKATTNYSAEGFAKAREEFQQKLEIARSTLIDTRNRATEKAQQTAAITEKYVSDNPWKALAITGSVGVIFGMLLSRR